jgi:hypothetical protein
MTTPDTRRTAPARPDEAEQTRDAARREREYGHSSGDRNVRHDEDDAPSHRGGIQREATPEDKDDLTGRD